MEITHQYYYHDNECKAIGSKSDDCICWHDEGTGAFAKERHDDPVLLKEWRIKPDNATLSGPRPHGD